MNCSHNYEYGERLTLHATGTSTCLKCGFDQSEIMDGATIIFRGHNQGMALFDLDKPFLCPSCEAFTNGYAEYCDGLSIGFQVDAEISTGGDTNKV